MPGSTNGNNFSLTKSGAGSFTLNGANTYTGDTTVNGGTLALGASNVLANTSDVVIGNATLNAATFTDTVGTLDVTSSAKINLGAGAALAFASSSAVNWTGGTLTLTGTFVSGASLRFGTNSSGLTPAQLALISAPGFSSFALNSNGFLTATAVVPYATWKTTNAPTGTTGDDFDGDGVSNGVEFVLGGTASTNDLGKVPTVSISNGNVVFSFMRQQSSIDGTTTVVIDVGTDLVNWAVPPSPYAVPNVATGPVNPGVTVVKDSPAPGIDTITLTMPQAPNSQGFARLRVIP